METSRIAVVGVGLEFPDASTTDELWDNVLAGRRAFRQIPSERMDLNEYWSEDPGAPDKFYSRHAALLRDYQFDRVGHKITTGTFNATDMTHWLALDVAERALLDAGFPRGEGLPKASTGVVFGNSLTGEFTRASVMRLRWPYVRRVVGQSLRDHDWADDEAAAFLAELESAYKAPFPDITEDSLAGGLSNTIAGRICNHLDLAGGGFTVDGACSSSLLAISNACQALNDHTTNVMIAGGVDLSIDPFEVIGFAKTNALATGTMKIYDRDSCGFWPGEGAGAVVLMREEDAIRDGHFIYANVTGWGVSSDGKGGMTRPEVTGHQRAIARAYARAGYDQQSVGYFEGHGTGTAVGDATELRSLVGARPLPGSPVMVSSIKGNIGHTKAAAGIAGFIKGCLAIDRQVIPPATGHDNPHPILQELSGRIEVPTEPAMFPANGPIRVGVSSMGFGGVNTHVALEQRAGTARKTNIDDHTHSLVRGRQDAELLLLTAATPDELAGKIATLTTRVARASMAELVDLAASVATDSDGDVRASVVATSPEEATHRLARLAEAVDALPANRPNNYHISVCAGVELGICISKPRIGFVFPGQAAGTGHAAGIHRRFPQASRWVDHDLGTSMDTAHAQPRLVHAALAGLDVLKHLGVQADVAAGHSLGELVALTWARVMSPAQCSQLARWRGQDMGNKLTTEGAMAVIVGDVDPRNLLANTSAVISCHNSPVHTVVSGGRSDIHEVLERARQSKITVVELPVPYAFHTAACQTAADEFLNRLAKIDFRAPEMPVISTATGQRVAPETDVATLLADGIVAPVQFAQAIGQIDADLIIEVGAGTALNGLVTACQPDVPVRSIDTDSPSLVPLLETLATCHAVGVDLDRGQLFADRLQRPIDWDSEWTFLTNPCSQAAGVTSDAVSPPIPEAPASTEASASSTEGAADSVDAPALSVLIDEAAALTELPTSQMNADIRPLDDLHMSSITVSKLVNTVTTRLGIPHFSGVPRFATATLGEIAELLDQAAAENQSGAPDTTIVEGAAPWTRSFVGVDEPWDPPQVPSSPGKWSPVGDTRHARDIATSLATTVPCAGGAVVVEPDETVSLANHLVEVVSSLRALDNLERLLVIQSSTRTLEGFAKTFHLENPDVATTVLTIDTVVTDAVISAIARSVNATDQFVEAAVEPDATLTRPFQKPITCRPGKSPLTPSDVVLVTGGAKGITAECALSLARTYGCKLLLTGRSNRDDPQLMENLKRFDAASITWKYSQADVTSSDEVGALLADNEDMGPVTALLHGAGTNNPATVDSLTVDDYESTLAPKLTGLQTCLDAIGEDNIKVLLTFGSIIGRSGLRGEAHYATANALLAAATTRFAEKHPRARCLCFEWSVWSGTGMGESLGVVESFRRSGIAPVSTDDGVEMLHALLCDPSLPPVVVVAGRLSQLPTVQWADTSLPLGRFLDLPLTHTPHVELVTQAELTPGSDPYLNDHEFEGTLLFPAVMGLEAMAQVAGAVLDIEATPRSFKELSFDQPVTVSRGGSTTIRIAATALDETTCRVSIRSSETQFDIEHFSAVLCIDTDRDDTATFPPAGSFDPVVVDPSTELYGPVLFQGQRFQRLTTYQVATSHTAVATLSTTTAAPWFGFAQVAELTLTDPGVRDALMHVIQCCIPHATLLPKSIDEIWMSGHPVEGDAVTMQAEETEHHGSEYTYTVRMWDHQHRLVEQWTGLHLQAVSPRTFKTWPPSMLSGFIGRHLEDHLGPDATVVLEPHPTNTALNREDLRHLTSTALSRALHEVVQPSYRPDGRPELASHEVTAAHTHNLTMAVTAPYPIGCDVEHVHSADWDALLGEQHQSLLQRMAHTEDLDMAGTRLWSALESLHKMSHPTDSLAFAGTTSDGWVTLTAGQAVVDTWCGQLNDNPTSTVIALARNKEQP